jgi:uncharacterized protein
MKTKLLQEGPQKTWIIVFKTGEEPVSGLLEFARRHNLSASRLSAIGAFSSVELAYFDIDKRDYQSIPIAEQVEVLSLLGDITIGDSGPKLHAHVVVGKRDGSAWGGHLLKATVRPTLEVMISESPTHLARRHDPATGLALIDPDLPA